MYLDGDVRGECAVVQAREMTACPAIVSQDARFPRPGTCRPSASREVGAMSNRVAALNSALCGCLSTVPIAEPRSLQRVTLVAEVGHQRPCAGRVIG